MFEFPTIKLQLEGMKSSIIASLGNYHEEVETYVNESLKEIVDNFDFGKYLREEVEKQMKVILKSTIDTCLWETMRDEEIRTSLRRILKAKIMNELEPHWLVSWSEREDM